MLRMRKRWRVYLYILPTTIIILTITLFPLLYTVYISFFDYLMQTRSMTFAGVSNFVNLLQDERFYESLLVTLKIGLPALGLEVLIGFGLALLLSSIARGKGLLVSVLATPVMIPTTAAAMSFQMLYMPPWGPLNHILAFFVGHPVEIDWLGSKMAAYSVVIADVWQMTPFIMLIMLAGLSSVSEELYEAARIDGATAWANFRYITLPLVRFPLFVAVLLRAIDLFKMFDLVYVMTHGGPAGATETVSFYAYQIGIEFLRVGYGATIALVLLFIIVMLAQRLVKLMQLGEQS